MRRLVTSSWLICALALGGAPARAAIVDAPVAFTVTNTNGSLVPCLADGMTYTVSGRLVLPDGPAPDSVTLYLHGLGYGKWFWGFPGLDFALAMAEAGHASVTIDRIGYDESGHPLGYLSCLGAQADVVRQVIRQLREGTYSGTPALAFSRVALAGHSAGGAVAQVVAYSFPEEIYALAVLSYADGGPSMAALQAFGGAALACATGGSSPEPDAPAGYAPFGATDAEFQALMFHDADPSVVAAATAMRNLDPCGDDASIPVENVMSSLLLGTVTKPVFLLCGENDAIFSAQACTEQAARYGSAPTFVLVPGLGHAITLEREADAFREALSLWLAGQGF